MHQEKRGEQRRDQRDPVQQLRRDGRLRRPEPCGSPARYSACGAREPAESLDEVQPVLAPENLVLDHVSRCAEHATGKGGLRVLLASLRPPLLGPELHQIIRIEPGVADQGRKGGGVAGILLLLPKRLQHAMCERDGGLVPDRLACGDHAFRRKHLVRGKEARLDLDRNAQMLAPPLQLHEPVRLTLGRALGQRQAPRGGENRTEIHREDADARPVAGSAIASSRAAPRCVQGEFREAK